MTTIKDCFVSRFGCEGNICEADFSQLEVIGAAEISGDENMKQDIVEGIDSHSQSASWLNPQYTYEQIREGYVNNIPIFVKMRQNAKAPRFQLQYGAGAPSIAASNNIPLNEAKGFIERYYDRYYTLKAFQDSVRQALEDNKYAVEKTSKGIIYAGEYRSVTGRIYYVRQEEAPKFMQDRGEHYSFSPTKCKNYPIQGFATGDIVPEMIGRVMRNIFKYNLEDKCLLIGTIHDSILFDIHDSVREQAVRVIRGTMQAVPLAMEKRFGLKLSLPFHIDVEMGRDWNSLEMVR